MSRFCILCWEAGSNCRPFALQANALPTELSQHILFSQFVSVFILASSIKLISGFLYPIIKHASLKDFILCQMMLLFHLILAVILLFQEVESVIQVFVDYLNLLTYLKYILLYDATKCTKYDRICSRSRSSTDRTVSS